MPNAQLIIPANQSGFVQFEPYLGYGFAIPWRWAAEPRVVAGRNALETGLYLVFIQRLYLGIGATFFLDDCIDSTSCDQLESDFKNGSKAPLTTFVMPNISVGFRPFVY